MIVSGKPYLEVFVNVEEPLCFDDQDAAFLNHLAKGKITPNPPKTIARRCVPDTHTHPEKRYGVRTPRMVWQTQANVSTHGAPFYKPPFGVSQVACCLHDSLKLSTKLSPAM